MILWGVWQGRGKPAFQTFFQPFIKHMEQLESDGITITIDGKQIITKAILLAGTMDLVAKAYVTEMTQHNGKYGCITCADPGEVVKKGKGYTRVYPFREDDQKYRLRTSAEILQCGLVATESGKPEYGIKGVSSLHGLEHFDIVGGIVPDYMHGVLLGVTKQLLNLLLSSTNSKEPYFIGNRASKLIEG
ncbi:hypothetical protein KUTeg_009079 [Tegillarca granosa]|uniref:Uncharacterized protein n=1 Tax=Tegillarca granosa TaxID=220873 RepID=A0ABQ9FAT6_TEGGR|nr:hypothetical protein KUTeg_009079 [Tegillarca granosa]